MTTVHVILKDDDLDHLDALCVHHNTSRPGLLRALLRAANHQSFISTAASRGSLDTVYRQLSDIVDELRLIRRHVAVVESDFDSQIERWIETLIASRILVLKLAPAEKDRVRAATIKALQLLKPRTDTL